MSSANARADALATVRAWIDAFASADMDAARRLFADDGVTHTGSGDLVGFDGLLAWYMERRAREGAAFGYEVRDVVGAGSLVAVVLLLRNASHRWTQIAVYRVEGKRIREVWLHEAE